MPKIGVISSTVGLCLEALIDWVVVVVVGDGSSVDDVWSSDEVGTRVKRFLLDGGSSGRRKSFSFCVVGDTLSSVWSMIA